LRIPTYELLGRLSDRKLPRTSAQGAAATAANNASTHNHLIAIDDQGRKPRADNFRIYPATNRSRSRSEQLSSGKRNPKIRLPANRLDVRIGSTRAERILNQCRATEHESRDRGAITRTSRGKPSVPTRTTTVRFEMRFPYGVFADLA